MGILDKEGKPHQQVSIIRKTTSCLRCPFVRAQSQENLPPFLYCSAGKKHQIVSMMKKHLIGSLPVS